MKPIENGDHPYIRRNIAAVRRLSALALFASLVYAFPFAGATAAQETSAEASPVKNQPATTGPISDQFSLKKIDGTINLLVNNDGTYLFSGRGKSFSGKDIDITLALKNTTGAVILIQYVGDASKGIQFSVEGQNPILADNFASFASGHDAAWEYRLSENSAGREKLYQEREKKKEELAKKEMEAKKKHQEKLAAEHRAKLKKEEQKELAEEKAQSAGGSSGGGSSVGSVLETIGTVVGSVLAFL